MLASIISYSIFMFTTIIVPSHDPCRELSHLARLSRMSVRGRIDECPLKRISRYRPIRGGCWSYANNAIAQLQALGYNDEANALRRNHKADDVERLGHRLLQVVSEEQMLHRRSRKKPEGARDVLVWDYLMERYVRMQVTSFEQALETIDHMAKWLLAVAKVDSGVEVLTQTA